jgi:predicted regulator of Ras-like GTPase activity (Roadblock/LC7/MglB family)
MRPEYPYALRTVDAQQALADLTEISSQIQTAVVFDTKGKVAGSTLADAAQAEALAKAAGELLSEAEGVRTGESPLTQLEVATGEGSVFIVRDGTKVIAATTGGNPTVGLVFYDLKSALRSVKTTTPRKRASAAKKASTATKKKTTATTTRKKKTDAS